MGREERHLRSGIHLFKAFVKLLKTIIFSLVTFVIFLLIILHHVHAFSLVVDQTRGDVQRRACCESSARFHH